MTIPEFFTALRQLPKGTFTIVRDVPRGDGLIRSVSPTFGGLCPIELLYKERHNALPLDYHHAAAALGLNATHKLLIIAAADSPDGPMRAELEEACGLKTQEAVPAVREAGEEVCV